MKCYRVDCLTLTCPLFFFFFSPSGEDRFSAEATSALEEMTRGVPLLAQVRPNFPCSSSELFSPLKLTGLLFFSQVSNYDNNTGLPLIHLWNMVGEEV